MKDYSRAYLSDVLNTINQSDVLLEVLDSRDPESYRIKHIEENITRQGKNIIFVLNKIDLVPVGILAGWIAHLEKYHPTVLFTTTKFKLPPELASKCGISALVKIIKTISQEQFSNVGVFGYPNVGKSSLINSLTRSKCCVTGPLPGVTKKQQSIKLDKNVNIIDTPGVVFEDGSLTCVNVNTESDPYDLFTKLYSKSGDTISSSYGLQTDKDPLIFLTSFAKKTGKIRQHGIPDIELCAKSILTDWFNGKIRHYTNPPSSSLSSEVQNTQLLNNMKSEFIF